MSEENENQEPQVRQIELSHFATITLNGDGTGSIDGPLIDERLDGWEEDPVQFAIDNLFGVALLHALAGVDVTSRAYERGFEQQINSLVEEIEDD